MAEDSPHNGVLFGGAPFTGFKTVTQTVQKIQKTVETPRVTGAPSITCAMMMKEKKKQKRVIDGNKEERDKSFDLLFYLLLSIERKLRSGISPFWSNPLFRVERDEGTSLSLRCTRRPSQEQTSAGPFLSPKVWPRHRSPGHDGCPTTESAFREPPVGRDHHQCRRALQ